MPSDTKGLEKPFVELRSDVLQYIRAAAIEWRAQTPGAPDRQRPEQPSRTACKWITRGTRSGHLATREGDSSESKPEHRFFVCEAADEATVDQTAACMEAAAEWSQGFEVKWEAPPLKRKRRKNTSKNVQSEEEESHHESEGLGLQPESPGGPETSAVKRRREASLESLSDSLPATSTPTAPSDTPPAASSVSQARTLIQPTIRELLCKMR